MKNWQMKREIFREIPLKRTKQLLLLLNCDRGGVGRNGKRKKGVEPESAETGDGEKAVSRHR